MLDDDNTSTVTPSESTHDTTPVRRTRRRAASRPAGPPAAAEESSPAAASASPSSEAPADPPPAAKTAKRGGRKTTKKTAATRRSGETPSDETAEPGDSPPATTKKTAKKTAAKRPAKKPAKKTSVADAVEVNPDDAVPAITEPVASVDKVEEQPTDTAAAVSPVSVLFQPPDVKPIPRRRSKKAAAEPDQAETSPEESDSGSEGGKQGDQGAGDEQAGTSRRRRSRGGRNRRKPSDDDASADDVPAAESKAADDQDDKSTKADKDDKGGDSEEGSSRRRRRRRRSGEDAADAGDDPNTVTRVRQPRAKKDAVTSVEGSTRIEAKKQRRREGREAGRRRPPILSESEFLARRESVDRVMTIRQRGETTQIAVLEDDVLVEHYVAIESQSSIIGNVYLGRVQNVLPSMEAAFIDIGKGRNAVLYAGEVNWDLRSDNNQPRRIENALKPGQAILVQVSKDPIGHKGARLTSQISLPGRYLVYVPGGGTSGISRKLPDTERNRLKNLLKDVLPSDAGVIIRTAAEGASEDELTRDVTRLTARWEDIEKKSKKGQAPQVLYAEPDTTLKVVRDLFTEDFGKLVIDGDDAWDMVEAYVQHVAPDLIERLERYEGDKDVFEAFRIDEQIAKAMERKVWLPSGGSVVIDRTEAMTVVDVNTGKFTGSGGNLEETVTKNNLEAAEEIVRQLRLRDIGGIIVVDFIDMVLENNRDLVLRRLVECLGRDRTRHQVAEVTSLGLVQMTRKRISTGLLEAFSETCDHCQGRGVIIHTMPIEPKVSDHGRGGSGGSKSDSGSQSGPKRSGRRRGSKRSAGSGGDDAGTTADASGSDNGKDSSSPSREKESVGA